MRNSNFVERQMSESRAVAGWLSRPVVGLFVVLFLTLLMQIPISSIRALIDERLTTRGEASAEIAGTWGDAQSVVGPRLVVPYRRTGPTGQEAGWVNLLPASLDVTGEVDATTLRRGLFGVPVYTSRLELSGQFTPEDLHVPGMDAGDLLWEEAKLVIELTDPKGIGAESSATWDDLTVQLEPETVGSLGRRGVHAAVVATPEASLDFHIRLSLKGSGALWLTPFSRDTEVRITSNWPHPSFGGAWLPTERRVAPEGFSAMWQIPSLGRDYAQSWNTAEEPLSRIEASRFGAELVDPVDPYRMADRSTKYASLFLALTFGLLWLFDTLTGLRVHPVQYLLVGAAMCLFYLLELALSEHIGFMGAYATASASVITIVSGYATSVLRSLTRGVTLGGVLGVLYAYLLVLLSLERYALLVGSFGLLAALSGVMYLTRWIDWGDVVRAEPAAATPA